LFTATVRAWNANGELSAGVPVTVLIAPLQAAAQVAASEAEGSATITVSLAAPLPMAVGVAYATVDGTAQAGGDYGYTAGVLTFAPGETVKAISVPILEDGVAEPDEWFFMHFQPPDPALGQMQMMGRLNTMNDASAQQGEVLVVRVLIPGANRIYLPTVRRMQ
ncbi:MAG: Calx-beta domain-containing protein, partial [Anaerolineae bacterium]|nr:hypothetical protein [Thermoflexales bacterium]MDW8407507.1 Calx-beta domain-containing protein [Anaerolineae bacterium]